MDKLFTKKHMLDLILGAILILYIVFPINTPVAIANIINSPIGIIVVIIITISLFSIIHPIIAVIGLLAAFELLHRSKINFFENPDSNLTNDKLMNEKLKKPIPVNEFATIKSLPVTLEEEIIKKRVPLVNNDYITTTATYKPILETDNNCAKTTD